MSRNTQEEMTYVLGGDYQLSKQNGDPSSRQINIDQARRAVEIHLISREVSIGPVSI